MDSTKSKSSTKKKIVEAALELFRSRGYDNVSVQDICEKCSITRGGYYYYYKTKDDILDDLFVSTQEIPADEMAAILQPQSYLEQFLRLYSYYIHKMEEAGPEVISHLNVRNMRLGKGLTSPENAPAHDMYVTLIQKAKDAGEVTNPASAADIVEAALHIGNSMGYTWCVQKGNYDYEANFRRLIRELFAAR